MSGKKKADLKKKNIKPPGMSFKMPRSKAVVLKVYVDENDEKYFQLFAGGSYEAETARRISRALLKVAKWMEMN